MSDHSFPHVSKPSRRRQIIDKITNFTIGGASGMMATSVVQPVDMVKVRIQLKSESHGGNLSPVSIAKEIYAKEGGMKAFYKGIDSALLRQAVYCSLRLGLYFNISDYLKTKNGGKNLTVWEKVVASGGSGLIASFIGNPCDLALVRMQADATIPINQRRNYKNVFDAIYRIITEEGVFSLWKGATPTLLRAASVNLSMMTPYDECKEKLAKLMGKETKFTLLLSCAIAGTMVSTVSLPFDNIKTKLQKMKPDISGKYPYKGVIDCFMKSLAKEGVRGFWAGLPTYYCRCAPHSMITLLASDLLKKMAKGF